MVVFRKWRRKPENESLRILVGARRILADERRWIHHGPVAVDAHGTPTGLRDPWDGEDGDALAPDAVAWCLVGACQRVVGRDISYSDPLLAPLRDVIEPDPRWYEAPFGLMLGMWNDQPERTHDEVLAALDRAIARAGVV